MHICIYVICFLLIMMIVILDQFPWPLSSSGSGKNLYEHTVLNPFVRSHLLFMKMASKSNMIRECREI